MSASPFSLNNNRLNLHIGSASTSTSKNGNFFFVSASTPICGTCINGAGNIVNLIQSSSEYNPNLLALLLSINSTLQIGKSLL